MTGSDAYAAHVQVLTAEVRTLVVGSRQITMSVYGQLDRVEPSQIEPLGRINPKDSDSTYIFTVGRDVATGALVRSYTPAHPETFGDDGRLHLTPGVWARYAYWKADADPAEQREQFMQIAARWAALDLIVLAGLR